MALDQTPIHIKTRTGDNIYFDGRRTFNFAGMETEELRCVIAMRDGLSQLLAELGIRAQREMEAACDGS